jgi:hypothetical protein
MTTKKLLALSPDWLAIGIPGDQVREVPLDGQDIGTAIAGWIADQDWPANRHVHQLTVYARAGRLEMVKDVTAEELIEYTLIA